MMNGLQMFRCLAVAVVILLLCHSGALEQAGAAERFSPDSVSIGPRFHYETGFGDEGYRGENVGWGKQVPVYKTYDNVRRVRLPEPADGKLTVSRAVQHRRSVRSFRDSALSLPVLNRMLLSTYGIVEETGRFARHPVPSAGALYPMEVYLFVSRVDTLTPGIYHFNPSDTALDLIDGGDHSSSLLAAANNQSAVGNAPAALVLTARFDRTTVKYGDRGYRYVYMECGCLAQNVYLQATSLGLGTVAVGAFHDEKLNEMLAIDGISEAALLVMPLGHPM